ncbi:unnamed protein product, partial [Mesorhabditis spiculigera]
MLKSLESAPHYNYRTLIADKYLISHVIQAGASMENENPIVGSDEQKKLNAAKKLATRPAMQIYRPPGLRSGGASSPPSDSPPENGDVDLMQRGNPGETAGQKPSTTRPTRPEENNNHRKSPPRAKTEERLNRTESSLSTESAVSQKSSGAGSHHEVEKQKPAEKAPRPRQQQHRPAQPKEKPRKIMGPKEIGEAADALRALHIPNNVAELEQLVASEFRDEGAAECVGNAIVQHAIEGGTNCCKQSTKTLAAGWPSTRHLSTGMADVMHRSICAHQMAQLHRRQKFFILFANYLPLADDVRRSPSHCPTTRLLHAVLRSPCCSPTRPATQTTSAWLRQLQASAAMFDNAVSATATHHGAPRLPFATSDTWQWRLVRRHSSWRRDSDMPSNFAPSRVYLWRLRISSGALHHNLLFDNVIIYMVVTFHDVHLAIDTAANIAYFYSLFGDNVKRISRSPHRVAFNIFFRQPQSDRENVQGFASYISSRFRIPTTSWRWFHRHHAASRPSPTFDKTLLQASSIKLGPLAVSSSGISRFVDGVRSPCRSHG